MTASPIFWRGTYHVRITGGRDTKRRIPASVFGDVLCDRKSKRGDKLARKYADGLESDGSVAGLQAIGRGSDLTAGCLPLEGSRNGRASATTESPDSNREEVMPNAGWRREGADRPTQSVTVRDWTSRMSLAAIGALFLSRNRAILDPKTLRRYECTLKQLVAFFGDERPDQIHIGRLEAFRDERLQAHWTPRLGTVPRRQISPRTVHGELTFAVQLLGFGFDRKIETGMTALPVRKAPDVADRCRTRGRILTIEEFWRAYEAAGSLQRAANRFQRLLALGLTTMLRSDALLRLVSDEGARWVDLVARTVTVPPQFVKKGRGRVRKELTLPLCEWAVLAIGGDCWLPIRLVIPAGTDVASAADRESCAVRSFDGADFGGGARPPARSHRNWDSRLSRRPEVGTIETSTWGAPVASVQSTLNRIAQIAGIRHFSLHDIRATAATYLLNRGVQKIAVDRLIGHAMAPNDARYYQVDQLATEAVRLFDDERNAHRGIDGVNVVAIGAGR